MENRYYRREFRHLEDARGPLKEHEAHAAELLKPLEISISVRRKGARYRLRLAGGILLLWVISFSVGAYFGEPFLTIGSLVGTGLWASYCLRRIMKKHRLQFDVSEETLTEIDGLKQQTGAATRAELLREALKLLAWYRKKKSEGYSLEVTKGDERKEVELV